MKDSRSLIHVPYRTHRHRVDFVYVDAASQTPFTPELVVEIDLWSRAIVNSRIEYVRIGDETLQ